MARLQLKLLIAFTSLIVALCQGCQTSDHPWAGEQYQIPVAHTNPAQSIYAPMPTILPQVDAKDITGGASDADLEAALMDL
jgi:hypothetical protein